MTKNSNQHALGDIVAQLRKLTPKRALTYGESLTTAKRQARVARQMLDATGPALALDWILCLPGLEVQALPAHKIAELATEETSGFTTKKRGGGYLIAINKNRSHTHRRWTLAHETKHLIDYPYARTLHSKLGHGSKDVQARQIERICDHFAAHLLVPSTLLKQAWARGIQDVNALAGLFDVSSEAMHIRLSNEGFLDDSSRPIATYFRRSGLFDHTLRAA
jgi:hypothetical protein